MHVAPSRTKRPTLFTDIGAVLDRVLFFVDPDETNATCTRLYGTGDSLMALALRRSITSVVLRCRHAKSEHQTVACRCYTPGAFVSTRLECLVLSVWGASGKRRFRFPTNYFRSIIPARLQRLVIRTDVWHKGLLTPAHVHEMAERLPRLTHLEVCGDVNFDATPFDFSGMRRLQHLFVSGWGGDIYHLVLPPHLTVLRCGREISDFDVDVLPNSLTALECYKWEVSREAALKSVPNLTHLDMTCEVIQLAHLPLTLTSARIDMNGRRNVTDGSLSSFNPDWPPLLTDLETNGDPSATLVLPSTLKYARLALNFNSKPCFRAFFEAPCATHLVKANLLLTHSPPGYDYFVHSLKSLVSLQELSLHVRTMELESVLQRGNVSLPCARALRRLSVVYSPVSVALHTSPLNVSFTVPHDGTAAALEKISVSFVGIGARTKTVLFDSLFATESMNVNHLLVSVRCFDSVIYMSTTQANIIADLGHCTVHSWIPHCGVNAGTRQLRLLSIYPRGIDVFAPEPCPFESRVT